MAHALETDTEVGPASYTTGGFAIATTLANIDWANVEVQTPGANLPHCIFVITRNSPSAGSFKVQILRVQYDDLTSIDSVSGLPSGVTARATSGGTYDNESAHVHSMNHDHAATTSTTNTTAGGGTTLDLTAPINIGAHTHSFDPPSFTGNTGAGSAHTHVWDNIYEHQHSVTQTETNASLSELANGTDLSGTTFIYKAYDA